MGGKVGGSTHFGAEVKQGTVARPSWVADRKCQCVGILFNLLDFKNVFT